MFSCQLPDNEVSYTEGLVVFGRIELFEFMNETIGTIDTLRVSLSSDINSNIDNANQLYICFGHQQEIFHHLFRVQSISIVAKLSLIHAFFFFFL